ncbi:hypothetical protein FRC11_011665, partial [Ceratobasidium sp. 423]
QCRITEKPPPQSTSAPVPALRPYNRFLALADPSPLVALVRKSDRHVRPISEEIFGPEIVALGDRKLAGATQARPGSRVTTPGQIRDPTTIFEQV